MAERQVPIDSKAAIAAAVILKISRKIYPYLLLGLTFPDVSSFSDSNGNDFVAVTVYDRVPPIASEEVTVDPYLNMGILLNETGNPVQGWIVVGLPEIDPSTGLATLQDPATLALEVEAQGLRLRSH